MLGDTLYVNVNFYVYAPDKSTHTDYGRFNLYLPYADNATFPTDGYFATNGQPSGNYDTYVGWMADFNSLSDVAVRLSSHYQATQIFRSIFPKVQYITIQDADLVQNSWLVLENTANNKILAIQYQNVFTYFFPTIQDFLNNTNRVEMLGAPFFRTNVNATNRDITRNGYFYATYYSSLGLDGAPLSAYQVYVQGMSSTNNSLYMISTHYGEFAAAEFAKVNSWAEWSPYVPQPEDTDPYANIDGESEITGGGVVNVPGFPGLTATSTGIIGLFAPSAAQMQALASYMWTDFGGQGTTTEDILKEIVEALKRSISNPLDYVIGLNIIPSQGLSIGESAVIRFGFISSGVSMPRLSNQYFTVDCGSLDFDPICGDTFLDYAPYSKFSIYLPYIGVKEVDANDFVGHTIGVVYHGDTVTGGVTAYITKDGSVMYQYSGCCALNIPLSSDNWGNTISGAVQIATSIVGAAASGGAAGIAQAAVSGVASVAANPSMLSPQVAHSGAVSGGAGCMAVQYPFVIREAVRFHSTEYFNTLAGYPAFYYRSLAEVSGYTKVLEIHLRGMTATQEEVDEIETILKQGAIF